MVLIFYTKISDTVGKVNMAHYQPQLLSESERAGGLIVNDYPNPELVKYKSAIPYINLETKEVYYEYVDRPLTKEEQLEKENEELKAQLAALQSK